MSLKPTPAAILTCAAICLGTLPGWSSTAGLLFVTYDADGSAGPGGVLAAVFDGGLQADGVTFHATDLRNFYSYDGIPGHAATAIGSADWRQLAQDTTDAPARLTTDGSLLDLRVETGTDVLTFAHGTAHAPPSGQITATAFNLEVIFDPARYAARFVTSAACNCSAPDDDPGTVGDETEGNEDTVSAVPLPPGAALGIAALVALGAIRRRSA